MIEFPKTYSALLIGLPGVGKSEYCMQLARDYLRNGEKVVYITTEKSPSDIRERMREIDMDLEAHESKSFLFIDIFTRESDPKEENVLYVDNPANLNMVSVRVSEASDALGTPVRIIFDSLSTFFLHASEGEVRSFFDSINKKIKKDHSFALFTLHEEMHDDKVVIALKAMVLCVMEMDIEDAPNRRRKFRVAFAKGGLSYPPDWIEFKIKKEGMEFGPVGEPTAPGGKETGAEGGTVRGQGLRGFWKAAKIAGVLLMLVLAAVIIGGFFKGNGAPDSGGAHVLPEIEGQIYFFDDFEDGDLKGWDICFDCGGDKGSVVSEDGSKVVRGIGQNDLHAASPSISDYTFMGRLKIAAGCAFVWVREGRGRYQFSICPEGSQIFLSVDDYQAGSTMLAQESAFIPMNLWQDFKIVVTGINLKFYLNDRLIIEAADESNTFPSGRVGIGGGDDSKVYFDDIIVMESPHCDDGNECTIDSYDYQEQKCVTEPAPNCCGNGICDKDTEDYSSCAADCPNCDDKNDCTVDEYDHHKQECVNTPILDVVCCGNGACEIGEDYESCTRDCPNCDDANECTEDSYDYHKGECVNKPVIPCCGNGICDEGVEDSLSCPGDCVS
ncbi:AAA family ATPase, partial [archaeon]|nr:AAA family ATPase [archaeon]